MTTVLARGAHYDGDLRADLLAAALDIVTEDGPDAVTVRAVAGRVGVSHAAPSRWYPSKSHLLTAVATEAFGLLTADIARAQTRPGTDRAGDPTVVLAASASAYLDFAARHPGHFAVMWREDLLLDDPALLAAGDASLQQFLSGVRDAMDAGWAPGRDLQPVADLTWSTVHGLAVLRAAGPYQALSETEFRERARATFRMLADALA